MGQDYLFGHSEHETARLKAQASLLEPYTRRFLVDAGIAAGMRVLDIGSGAGDVALSVLDLVGASGAVVGVDYSPAILETARQRAQAHGHRNITFVAGDIATLELDGEFDALVGRCVLFFVRDRVAVLRRLVRSVRAGGVVAFQEPGNETAPPAALPPSPLLNELWRWITEVYRRTDADLFMGLRLFQIFKAAGLPDPRMHLDALAGGGPDWPGYAYLASLVRVLLPRILEHGIATESEIRIDSLADRLRAEITSAGGAVTTWSFVSAYCRIPEREKAQRGGE